ncbi:hypothetical protein C2759_02600 [Polynucleobacter sp. MG-Unter2-18]|nr:hypothetical protein [Polynucleobacter sp. MG-Unter2-18]QWD95046.1 hypothetical protein C2759_02600 [Polynucleobacter sp. MG-Unter2-18]
MKDQKPSPNQEPEWAAFLAYEKAILMLIFNEDQTKLDQFEQLPDPSLKS